MFYRRNVAYFISHIFLSIHAHETINKCAIDWIATYLGRSAANAQKDIQNSFAVKR